MKFLQRISAFWPLLFCCFGKIQSLRAQSGGQPITLPAFFEIVKKQHPSAVQANLVRNLAAADLRKARGGFDLKLYGDFESKVFNNKTYYAEGEYGAKWPTSLLGLQWKAGYATASGTFLDPESGLPAAGQGLLGFEWTLGRGLLLDERRADLRIAQTGLRRAEAEQTALLNDLLYESGKMFWSAALAQAQVGVFEQALARARERFAGLRDSWQQGDKAAIDTLEAFILVQSRQFDLNEARNEARNAAAQLENFLWGESLAPEAPFSRGALGLPLLPETLPQPLPVTMAGELSEQLPATHPELKIYQTKLEQLGVEFRLARENLKPQLDLSYNFLGNGPRLFPYSDGPTDWLTNNMKWGLSFSYPIQNRKARADFQKIDIKTTQTNAEITRKTRDLRTKVAVYANETNLLAEQTRLYADIVRNYRALLDGELEKFAIGESSVFLVNSREQKWLESQIKYLKLRSEWEKARLALDWASGNLR